MKILILEDDSSCSLAMSQYLAARGYVPELATELEEAEALLSNGSFDAVITEVRLANRRRADGLRLLEFVGEHGLKPRLIVVTAYDSSATRDEALRLGADDFFVKPVSLERVAAALEARPVTVD